MAQSDWAAMSNGLSSANVAHTVTQGTTPPSGGGSFVYAFHSLQATEGAVGLTVDDGGVDFSPMASGCRVSGALQRNGTENDTVMLVGALDSNDVQGEGYIIGLTHDEEPSHLVVVKGSPVDGLEEAASGLLMKSTQTFAKGTWVHVQMDVIVQPNGDVLIQVFANDLSANDVTSPVWAAIDGMSDFIDDAVGINSGSLPYNSGGYVGYAYFTKAVGRYGFVDHVKVARQL